MMFALYYLEKLFRDKNDTLAVAFRAEMMNE